MRRAPPPAERFYVARPPPEVAARIGRGAQGSLSSGEVKGLPTVPSERQCDVYYDDDDEPFVRVAPIEAGSRLQECAAHVAKLFIARYRLTGPTPRGHDGGAAEYHVTECGLFALFLY